MILNSNKRGKNSFRKITFKITVDTHKHMNRRSEQVHMNSTIRLHWKGNGKSFISVMWNYFTIHRTQRSIHQISLNGHEDRWSFSLHIGDATSISKVRDSVGQRYKLKHRKETHGRNLCKMLTQMSWISFCFIMHQRVKGARWHREEVARVSRVCTGKQKGEHSLKKMKEWLEVFIYRSGLGAWFGLHDWLMSLITQHSD